MTGIKSVKNLIYILKNQEVLKWVQENLNFSKSFKDTRKRITPHESNQNLLQTASILIAATVFSNGDINHITMETSVIIKISIPAVLALFRRFSFTKLN